MMSSSATTFLLAVSLVLAVITVEYPSSAFTVTTTTTSGRRVAAYGSTVLPRSSTLMNNDETETAADSEQTQDEEEVVVAASDTETVELGTPAAVEEEEQPKHVVYIGNFAFTTTADDLRALFAEKVGGDDVITIESIDMPSNADYLNEVTGEPMSKGFGFITVASAEQVQAAADALDQIEFNGRTIRVNKLKSKEEIAAERADRAAKTKNYVPEGQKKLYVGNLSFDAAEDDVKAAFEEFGEVNDVYMPMKDGRRRGFAFVTMAEEAANLAMADMDGTSFFDRRLVVNEPLKAGEKPVQRGPRNKQFKIYVGNLSFYTSKETLKEIFEEFGDVYDCYLPVDPETERARGFGFVTMEREAGETAIAELDGMELDDRVIRINEAVGKQRSKPNRAEESDFGF